MEADVYIGINLYWDYVNKTITFSMPNYVRNALHRFQHIFMVGKEYSPHICAQIQYGQKIQYANHFYSSGYLSDKETNLVQQVCGHFLYYAIAIENIILTALCDISLDIQRAQKQCNTRSETG